MNDAPLVTFEIVDNITVGRVGAASVLDAVNVTQFGNEILNFLKKLSGVNLMLDFENVEYLSSAVLTELLRVNQTIQNMRGNLRLCGLRSDVRKVFEITNLDKVFTIYGDYKQALKRFERSLEIAERENAWSRLSKED
ncbi:MAG TPA: STAS domain-containing protein [Candidatus Hydrogenedentes bacterium]|nr:STAS domain-containing protein [Candidatus Hydrogenedentota bacterium]HQM47188.1 STAS domain-containing protein [Candidatus Hydrogenedentota bacterium]